MKDVSFWLWLDPKAFIEAGAVRFPIEEKIAQEWERKKLNLYI